MISFSCLCPVIDDQFCSNIVKVPVDPWVNSRVDPQTTFIDNFMIKLIVKVSVYPKIENFAKF